MQEISVDEEERSEKGSTGPDNAETPQIENPGQPQKSHPEQPDPESDPESDFERLWTTAIDTDEHYRRLRQAVNDDLARFPRDLRTRISISECRVDEQNRLKFRDRLWVPDYEPLRTRLMQILY